jgi:hypothetical protein
VTGSSFFAGAGVGSSIASILRTLATARTQLHVFRLWRTYLSPTIPFDPSWAGAALVIAICALAEGGIVTAVDGKHAAIIVQFATSILYDIENK